MRGRDALSTETQRQTIGPRFFHLPLLLTLAPVGLSPDYFLFVDYFRITLLIWALRLSTIQGPALVFVGCPNRLDRDNGTCTITS